MKTLFVNARFLNDRVTGSGRFALEILRELKGFYPNLELLAPKKMHPANKDICNEFKVTMFGVTGGMLWEQVELPLYLMRRGGSHLLLNLCNTAPVLYRRNILVFLDIIWKTNPEWFSKKLTNYHNLITGSLLRSSVALGAISDQTRQQIYKSYKTKREIHVVHCAVSLKMGSLQKQENTNGKYILAVSSIDPRKNFGRLIEAFVSLNLKDTALILVGQTHPTFAKVDFDQHSGAENIRFTGYLEDDQLINLYQHAQAFVYPSLAEGFGIPPLEAMMNDCPVITSNISSLPEVCGDAALYVDPYSVESIAGGIQKILGSQDLRTTLIEKGRERITHFSWKKSASILNDVITSIKN